MKKISKILFVMFLFLFSLGVSNKVLADGNTWNPNDKYPTYGLTNNNLTAIANGSYSIKSTQYVTSGKYYWEIKLESVSANSMMVGIANQNFDTKTEYFNSVNSFSYYGHDATLYPAITPYGIYFKDKDIIGIALDVDNHTIDFFVNGVEQGVRTIPTWSKYYAFLTEGGSGTGINCTANFGSSPFSYPIPSGYRSWDNIASLSISLNKTTDNLQVGQIHTLTATITPDTATNKTLTWKSSDDSIATVDQTGKVTTIKEGTATITATTTDGSNLSASCVVTVTSQTPPVTQGVVLNVEPEKNKIKLNETVSANLIIDNIKDIAAEDVRIKYDSSKLQFLGMDQVDGIKLVKGDSSQAGELRLILASKGAANVVEAKKVLLKLNFKGIAAGDALVDVTKGRVSDGIEMEKDLTDEQCGQATITIDNEALVDVNKDGQFTLLDLAIDGRHYSEDPIALTQYNTDIVVNKAIDDDDLTKIGEYMLANPNYKF